MANPTIVVTGQDNASAVLARIEGSVKRLGKSFDTFQTIAGIYAKFGTALAVFYQVKSAVDSVLSLAKAFDDLDEAAQGIGVTALELKELQTAARLSGLEGDQLNKVLVKFNQRLQEANKGNRESIEYFRRLGVEFKTAAGAPRPLLDALGDFSDKFSSFGNTAKRAAFEVGFFNERIGPKAAAYLSNYASGLRVASGATQETIDRSLALQKQIDGLSVSFDRLKSTAITVAAPGLTAFLDALDEVKFRANLTVTAIQLVITTMDKLRQQRIDERYPKVPQPIGAPTTGGFTAQSYLPPKQPEPPNPEDIAQATEAQRKQAAALKEAAEAAHEFSKAGLDAYQRNYAAEGARANAVLAEHNRLAQQSIDLKEEDRQAGLASYRAQYEAQSARARAVLDKYNEEADALKGRFEDIGLVFESAVSRMFQEGGVSAKNFWRAMLADMGQVLTKALVMIPIMKALKTIFETMGNSSGSSVFAGLFKSIAGAMATSGKAGGGNVYPDRSYVVGELGPELFRPKTAGTIIPNNALAGEGGVSITQNIRIDSRSDAASIMMAMNAARQLAVRDITEQTRRRRL